MKDEIKKKINKCDTFEDVQKVIDDYIDYYNSDRPQWDLAKLTPDQYFDYYLTGEYPLKA